MIVNSNGLLASGFRKINLIVYSLKYNVERFKAIDFPLKSDRTQTSQSLLCFVFNHAVKLAIKFEGKRLQLRKEQESEEKKTNRLAKQIFFLNSTSS